MQLWRSPVASAFDVGTDGAGLVRLAVLVDEWTRAQTLDGRLRLSAEIRLQEERYGLSPVARSRLQWQLPAKTSDGATVAPPRRREKDPRMLFVRATAR